MLLGVAMQSLLLTILVLIVLAVLTLSHCTPPYMSRTGDEDDWRVRGLMMRMIAVFDGMDGW